MDILSDSEWKIDERYNDQNTPDWWEMKKGAHPQLQWISYVTQSGRLMNVMMTKIHQVGKVYHFRAKRQMAESVGQIAKFRRRYEEKENDEDKEK